MPLFQFSSNVMGPLTIGLLDELLNLEFNWMQKLVSQITCDQKWAVPKINV